MVEVVESTEPLDDVIAAENVIQTENVINRELLVNSTEQNRNSKAKTLSVIKSENPDVSSSSSSVAYSIELLPRSKTSTLGPLGGKWKEAAKDSIIYVHCKKTVGELHKSRFGSGSKGKCILVGKQWFTPSEFEAHCGRSASKDWKRSIKFQGHALQTLIEEGFILVHGTSCSCAVCLEDEAAAGPVRLYQYTKRRRRKLNNNKNADDSVDIKPTVSQQFNDCETSISIPVSELNEHIDQSNAVTTITDMTISISEISDISHLPLSKAWKQMNQTLLNLEKNSAKARDMLQTLQERTERELEDQRRTFVREKEEAVNRAKLEAHLSSIENQTESEFLVEVQTRSEEGVRQDPPNHSTSTIQPLMLDTLPASPPPLSTSHAKKECVNCDRESLLVCSVCRRKSYCNTFCQGRDWPMHRGECVTLRNSPIRDVPGYIFMLSD